MPPRTGEGTGFAHFWYSAFAALLLSVVLAGCRTTAVSSRQRDIPTATFASQTPADELGERNQRVPAKVAKDESTTTTVEQPSSGRQRTLIPEWLRLGGNKEPVPLPTTPISSEAPPSSGPVEEFQ